MSAPKSIDRQNGGSATVLSTISGTHCLWAISADAGCHFDIAGRIADHFAEHRLVALPSIGFFRAAKSPWSAGGTSVPGAERWVESVRLPPWLARTVNRRPGRWSGWRR